ncbi:MAG: T9SS type A sorting domain-containing protein, partial [Bacteroidales bacterium]|nr:T9SS type A sorting domain-containing protein [Bacteroidales bacterium]
LFQSCVNSMLTDTINNDLYIACISIYRYDGEFFHHIGGAGSQVNTHAMCMYHGDLYIGGMFHTIDDIPAEGIAKWNGEEWSEVGGGVNAPVEALYVYKDELYLGGYFSQVGGYLPANGVARYHEPEVEDCRWLRPRIQTQGYQDTFYITQSQPYMFVNFVNNNAYAQSWEWDFGDGFTGNGSKDIQHGYYLPGEYNVKVEVTQNGCTKTAERTIVIEDYTGNKENKIENNGISIYPNPANDILTICLPPNINTAIASISDLSGKNYGFYDLNSNKTDIDISNLKSGKYFLQVKLKDKIENFGFVKE